MSYSKIKSFAKINLALNIISKKNNLHNIESIVSFINLHDEILIKQNRAAGAFFDPSFFDFCGVPQLVQDPPSSHHFLTFAEFPSWFRTPPVAP